MNIQDFKPEDRTHLLQVFQQFRARFQERGAYENRDILEGKLKQGEGELSKLDHYILVIAITQQVSDEDTRDHLSAVIKYRYGLDSIVSSEGDTP